MTVEKPKPKQLLRSITTGADSAMNQSQFLAITCNSLKAREKSRVHGAIGFGVASQFTTCTNPIIDLFNPPKTCIGIVFDFP